MMTQAVEITGLHKRFARPAVDGLSLTVAPGEFFALLGPNGAGKTTTLRMIAGLLRPDAGRIAIFGIDALRNGSQARRMVAWLPEEPLLYELLTPMEYLEFVAGLWSVEHGLARRRAQELLEFLGLWPFRHDRCAGFSRGMRQKTVLAAALIHEPRLLILDEPLTGLDAAAARDVKDLLTARVSAGASIVLTTHILEVAERLADRIGIIADGRMRAVGTLPELRSMAGAGQAGRGTLEEVFLHLVGQEARQTEPA